MSASIKRLLFYLNNNFSVLLTSTASSVSRHFTLQLYRQLHLIKILLHDTYTFNI